MMSEKMADLILRGWHIRTWIGSRASKESFHVFVAATHLRLSRKTSVRAVQWHPVDAVRLFATGRAFKDAISDLAERTLTAKEKSTTEQLEAETPVIVVKAKTENSVVFIPWEDIMPDELQRYYVTPMEKVATALPASAQPQTPSAPE